MRLLRVVGLVNANGIRSYYLHAVGSSNASKALQQAEGDISIEGRALDALKVDRISPKRMTEPCPWGLNGNGDKITNQGVSSLARMEVK